MKHQENKMKLESVDDVIDYCGIDNCLIFRNIEGKTEKHWIENYDKTYRKNPEVVEITHELVTACMDHDAFSFAQDIESTENEFYLRHYPLDLSKYFPEEWYQS